MSEFIPFPKIPRLKSNCTVTEKIDGTNAAVIVDADGNVFAQSRQRLITPGKGTDNFGFAGWVEDYKDELRLMGEGRHFGEWWGLGIQRGYGVYGRRFSLFNTARWTPDSPAPDCCDVVPVLYEGEFDTAAIQAVADDLREHGSRVARYNNPEGVVVYVHTSRSYFKMPFDTNHKGQS